MKRIILIFAMALCLASCSTDKEYHITTSDGVVLYAHVRGRGEPCLYLHGGPGSGSTWMKEMGGKELEKRYTMVYLDQRGVCRSTAPADDNFTLSRQTLDFEEVRQALNIDKWHLLGHSFGGILEIAYWRDYPESIEGMIFEDCTLSMEDCFKDSWLPAAIEIVGEENADPVAKDSTSSVGQRMAAIQRQLNNDTRALIFTCEKNRHVPDTLNSWVFHQDCISHGKGESVLDIEDYWEDFRPLSSTVTVPVLFFVGKYDRSIGPESYKDVHFPEVVIKTGDCGHFPFLESPEEWAAALDDYKDLCDNFRSNEAILEDFDYFFSSFEKTHPDPYSAFGGEKSFHKDVARLRRTLSRADGLDADRLQMETGRFLVPLHDGHTYCGRLNYTYDSGARILPLNLRTMTDGFFVWSALEGHEALLGADVKSIGGKSLDELMEKLALYVSAENKYGLYGAVSGWQMSSAALAMMLDDFDGEKVEMGFRTVSGADTTAVLPLLTADEINAGVFISTPTDQRFPSANFEYKWADKELGVMTFKCTHIVSRDCLQYIIDHGMGEYDAIKEWAYGDTPLEEIPCIAERFGAMLSEMKEAGAQHLIIDLRGNGGGWSPIVYPILYQLYGDKYLTTDLGCHYETRLSELYLQKNNLSLDEFNRIQGTSYGIGDLMDGDYETAPEVVTDSLRNAVIDGYMCLNKDMLRAQNGEPLYRPGHVYVVTNEGTFSAAFHFTYMLWKMGATIVGVPSSQSPNTFMESTPFTLPNTGIQCSVSNAIQLFFPADDPRANVFRPDWSPSWDDYKRLGFDSRADLLYILERIG
ncbi:MAG: alpha/beta fold hydrolase [Bacteroidia bacterium]|nr:alpha/beta fold hydrolase [Bacteroidia bacterium]